MTKKTTAPRPEYSREVFGYDYLTCVHKAIQLLIGDLEQSAVNPEDGVLCATYSKSQAKANVWFEPRK